jgi:polysaccharide biosynthesis protein PslJ
MTAIAVPPRRGEAGSFFLVAAAFGALVVAAAGPPGAVVVSGGVAGLLMLGAVGLRRPHIPWERVLGLLVLVILLIPLRRYKLPGDAGFSLEPYRLLVMVILGAWAAALLIDARVRLRKSGIELVMAGLVLAVIASIVANPGRVGPLEPAVLKGATFLVSFVIVFYLVVSVVRTRAAADAVVKTLVAGGALVGFLAAVEARTGWTPFTNLHGFIPVLIQDPAFEDGLSRGVATRAVGSAEHPIALSAVLVLLVPLAIYTARIAGPRWYLALGVIVIGALSTVSRTGVLMLLVVGCVFLWLRFRETRSMWPIILPLVVATQLMVPGTLASLRSAFFPEEGLIAQQQGLAGDCSSSGRVADIGPTLDEVAKKPFLGHGYGTRIVTGPDANACILDNQWLGTLYEVGIAGTLAWLLLFLGVIRRFGRAAKRDSSMRGWLLVATAASVAAYAVGMFTFDALGFSQVTFVLFIILGLGVAATRFDDGPPGVRLLPTPDREGSLPAPTAIHGEDGGEDRRRI